MRVERLSLIVALLVLLSTFYLAVTILPVNVKGTTRYVGGIGPDNYTKITHAITAANPGDTIYVYGGTYNEDVSVYKPLTLIGENRNTTIIRGSGTADTVVVTADWVNITGFTAENGGQAFDEAAIRLFFVQNCRVINNKVQNSEYGITLRQSSFNTVLNNIVSNNDYGIYFWGSSSSYNRILNNNISYNTAGIYLDSTTNNNTITDNVISNNGHGIALVFSSRNGLYSNMMVQNGIYVYGDSLGHWNTHRIDTSNTVNGKPVQYWKNVTGGTVPSGAGEVILANCIDVFVENQTVSNGSVGIEVGFSSRVMIANNVASSNYLDGIYIYRSDNITVTSNNVSSNGRNGIHFFASDTNTLTKNNIFLNGQSGVTRIEYSAIYVSYTNHSVIAENSVLSNLNCAFSFMSSNFNNVSNNNLSNNWNGLFFEGGNGNRIVNNTIHNNTHIDISPTGIGISLTSSSHNILVANSVIGHLGSILLSSESNDNTLVGNYLSSYDSLYSLSGISIAGRSNILMNNVMSGDGLVIHGRYLQYWNTHIIDTSNIVNGRPVYYWKNVTGGTVPLGASEVILANCTDVIVENQDLTNGSAGIELGFSSNNTISNNTVSDSKKGIYLVGSDNNAVFGNIVSDSYVKSYLNWETGIHLENSERNNLSDNNLRGNGHGIVLAKSNNNTVTDNNVWDSTYCGIKVIRWPNFGLGSHNNTITNNTVFNNRDGIYIFIESVNNTVAYNSLVNNMNGVYIQDASNNRIHHNNIIDNTQQAYDDRDTNEWDYGYPSGGNYWSDYVGVDAFSGPNQNLPGSDGIGDTPYVIDADSEDRYPLMNPLGTFPPSAPLNLSATAGDKQVFLTWDPPSFDGGLPITNYRIYRGITSGGETFLTEIGNVLTHPDTGLTNGQLYCYRVSAVNAIGEGPLSNEACATPTTTPGAPTILQAYLSGKDMENVTFTWTLSSDDGAGQNSVVSYAILRNTTYDDNGTLYAFLDSVPNGTTKYTDNLSGEGDPNNYFYQVCAIDLNNFANCSANQGSKFARPLSEGANLISIPLIQSNESTETLLQTVKWDKAWTYNSSVQKWKWYMKFKPYPGDLKRINLTQGFWVNATEQSNLTVAGIVPPSTTIYLREGWNLVGYPSFMNRTVSEALEGKIWVSVEGFDNASSPYHLRRLSETDIMTSGEGYWIYFSTSGVWTVRN